MLIQASLHSFLYSLPKAHISVEFSSNSLEGVAIRDILDLGFFPYKLSMKTICWQEQQETDSTEEKAHRKFVSWVLPQIILTSLGFCFLQNQLQK